MAGFAGWMHLRCVPFVRLHFRDASWRKDLIPMLGIPQLPHCLWSMSLLCSSTSLCGAEAVSHGPDCSADHVSTDARGQGGVVVQRPIPMVLVTMEVPQFRIVSVFSAELGSTADTCTASLYGAF